MVLTVRVREGPGHLDADALEVRVRHQERARALLVIVRCHGVELRLQLAIGAGRHRAIENHLGCAVDGQVHERGTRLQLITVVRLTGVGAGAGGRQLDPGEHDLRLRTR